MKKYFVLGDAFFIVLSGAICLMSINLDLGSFGTPGTGLIPFIWALIMGLLALADLLTGIMGSWKRLYGENVGSQINWGKVVLTIICMFVYAFLFETIGFLLLTFFFLAIFFQMLDPKPWWKTVLVSGLTTMIFYTVFKKGLDVQLPSGFFGF